MVTVLDKTDNDDKLITALRNEVTAASRALRALKQELAETEKIKRVAVVKSIPK